MTGSIAAACCCGPTSTGCQVSRVSNHVIATYPCFELEFDHASGGWAGVESFENPSKTYVDIPDRGSVYTFDYTILGHSSEFLNSTRSAGASPPMRGAFGYAYFWRKVEPGTPRKWRIRVQDSGQLAGEFQLQYENGPLPERSGGGAVFGPAADRFRVIDEGIVIDGLANAIQVAPGGSAPADPAQSVLEAFATFGTFPGFETFYFVNPPKVTNIQSPGNGANGWEVEFEIAGGPVAMADPGTLGIASDSVTGGTVEVEEVEAGTAANALAWNHLGDALDHLREDVAGQDAASDDGIEFETIGNAVNITIPNPPAPFYTGDPIDQAVIDFFEQQLSQRFLDDLVDSPFDPSDPWAPAVFPFVHYADRSGTADDFDVYALAFRVSPRISGSSFGTFTNGGDTFGSEFAQVQPIISAGDIGQVIPGSADPRFALLFDFASSGGVISPEPGGGGQLLMNLNQHDAVLDQDLFDSEAAGVFSVCRLGTGIGPSSSDPWDELTRYPCSDVQTIADGQTFSASMRQTFTGQNGEQFTRRSSDAWAIRKEKDVTEATFPNAPAEVATIISGLTL